MEIIKCAPIQTEEGEWYTPEIPVVPQAEFDLAHTLLALESLVETAEIDVPHKTDRLGKLLADCRSLIEAMRIMGRCDIVGPEYREVPVVFDPEA